MCGALCELLAPPPPQRLGGPLRIFGGLSMGAGRGGTTVDRSGYLRSLRAGPGDCRPPLTQATQTQ